MRSLDRYPSTAGKRHLALRGAYDAPATERDEDHPWDAAECFLACHEQSQDLLREASYVETYEHDAERAAALRWQAWEERQRAQEFTPSLLRSIPYARMDEQSRSALHAFLGGAS